MTTIRYWFLGFREGFHEPRDVHSWWYSMADSATIAYYNGYRAGTGLRRFLGERQS